ncbi:nuclear transport factor 2 family protein [Micromonospora halophytica]|uniref:SnoaL-like domain-containing protein n=1 Tax=Micromonospora halophytica TaxID=47864 RepID=A0A1C5H152_9ACTN|nr:nuclear transport factor 2 family protein [Micromonospora halophytica]SCG39653.1 SnoaL-like domain-containing protein [Micromonospora halophytica]
MTTLPGSDLAGYLRSYVQEMGFGTEDPEVVLDRYHTPDLVWHNDGIVLDRHRLIAHARPVRRTATEGHLDIHDTLTCGDRVAARYTLHAVSRGRPLATDIHLFGRLAPDGRLCRIDQLTRIVPAGAAS